MQQEYHVIGLMSGSSLDGLDIAYCRFAVKDQQWEYRVEVAETIPYSKIWYERLLCLPGQSAENLVKTHTFFGHYCGETVLQFIQRHQLEGKVDLVASHGHTVFHNPDKLYTCQIGDEAAIAAITGLPVAGDFRSLDIALGGQGAPIVPIGDLFLFQDVTCCLNLGGIANISVKANGKLFGYDICACNQLLNYLSSKKGLAFDEGGKAAREGRLDTSLFEKLENWDFLSLSHPKSLDRYLIEKELIPLFDENSLSVDDKLRTATEHIANAVAKELKAWQGLFGESTKMSVMLSGGATFNTFLIELIEEKAGLALIVPSPLLIEFKEAMVIAFMGVLRLRAEMNTLATVTGADRNSIGGSLYSGKI